MIPLGTTTDGPLDISAAKTTTAWQNTSGTAKRVRIFLRFTGCNGAAATFTTQINHFLSDGSTLVGRYTAGLAKAVTTDTIFERDLGAVATIGEIFVSSGDKISITETSSNASDTAVTIVVFYTDVLGIDSLGSASGGGYSR